MKKKLKLRLAFDLVDENNEPILINHTYRNTIQVELKSEIKDFELAETVISYLFDALSNMAKDKEINHHFDLIPLEVLNHKLDNCKDISPQFLLIFERFGSRILNVKNINDSFSQDKMRI